MIEPVFVANAVPKDTLFYLGVLGVEASALDFFVGIVYNSLAQRPTFDSDTMGYDTRRKAENAAQLTTDRQLLSALSDVKGILADRNLFMHGIVLSTTPGGAVDITRVYRGRYKRKDEGHSEDRIKELIQRIGHVNAVLLQHSGLIH